MQGNKKTSMINLQVLHNTTKCDKSSSDAEWMLVSVELIAKDSWSRVKVMLVVVK